MASYAVIFRTHFWDAFTARQFERLSRQVSAGDVFVLVDETRGHVPGISTDKVFRLTDAQILQSGYIDSGQGSIQWYSGDLPLYLFREAYPVYDYYVQAEYDVVVNTKIDDLISSVAADRADLVGLTNHNDPAEWKWRATCFDFYEPDDVRQLLICFSVYSERALRCFSRARLEHAERFRAGDATRWPMCEWFLASEAKKQGLEVTQISDYGNIDNYRWWPPYLESELPTLGRGAFVHPVLEPSKFVPSILKLEMAPSIRAFLMPNSWIHERLGRLGVIGHLKVVISSLFRKAFLTALRRKLHRIHTS